MTAGTSPRQRGLAAQEPTGFARVWASTACSSLADGLYLILLPLLALGMTHSPSLLAGIRLAQTAAGFVVGLPAGVLIDRFDRRRLMMAAEVSRGTALLGLAASAAGGWLGIPLLYLGAFVVGASEAISAAAAQAMVPMVVPTSWLTRANGRIYGTQSVMNDFVGAPLGAALLGLGAMTALAAPAGLYLAACACLLPLRGSFTIVRGGTDAPAKLRRDIREGISLLWRDMVLRRLALLLATAELANAAFFAVFVLFAVGAGSALHLTSIGYSLLITAAALGAVSGSAAADRLTARISGRVIILAMVASLAWCFAAPVLWADSYVVGSALLLSGFLTAVGGIYLTTVRQTLVPAHLLGRITSATRVLSLGARALGALLGGAIAQSASPRLMFALSAALMLTVAPWAWRADPVTRS